MKLSETRLPWIISGLPTQIRLLREHPSIEVATLQQNDTFPTVKQLRRYKSLTGYRSPALLDDNYVDEPYGSFLSDELTRANTVIINTYGVEQVIGRIRVPIEQTV